jgi:FPC/CPF motif-containing protein YcgG
MPLPVGKRLMLANIYHYLRQPLDVPGRSISDHPHQHRDRHQPNMAETGSQAIINEYLAYLNDKSFPCIGARAALARRQIKCMVAGHMACPKDDRAILRFLYEFVDDYRHSDGLFHSAAILFTAPDIHSEEIFDTLLWQRLQALADLDAENYDYDKRVDADPSSPNFSFSLRGEAFFIIGLHPASSRESRRFNYPVLAFNPHAQFQRLRETNSGKTEDAGTHSGEPNAYEKMKTIIRRRDIAYSGSVNPMLDDFGKSSEIYQYSGRNYGADWQCPLNIRHGKIEDNTSA